MFEKPQEFWNLLKLQEAFRSDRFPTFREILQVVFGLLPAVATREQLAGEHCARFLALMAPDATRTREIRHVFHAVLLDPQVRKLIEQGDYPAVRAHDAGVAQSIKTLGGESMESIKRYVRSDVPLDTFVKAS